jgi:hypothetical protein
MSCGNARRSNVVHLSPAAPPRDAVFVPDRSMIENYWLSAEYYLVACFAGATRNIIIERADRMFHAREALRKRGISV